MYNNVPSYVHSLFLNYTYKPSNKYMKVAFYIHDFYSLLKCSGGDNIPKEMPIVQ